MNTQKNSKIIINDKKFKVNRLKGIFFEKKNISIQAELGSIIFLIAGIKKKIIREKILKLKKNFYKVNKPWGNELWLNGEVKTFAFKRIFIKKGFQTSLQYHKKKSETNFLHKGNAELIYSKFRGTNSKDKIISNLKSKRIKKGNFVNVYPNIIHRIKAKTDITLFEVSTPHLSDVVRIADDSNRKDGKIATEHKRN